MPARHIPAANGQAAAIDFLASPAAHDGDGPVEIVQTHGALVFLGPRDALKMKRAVRYDYMDLSTLEKRRTLLTRELELNAPTAPAIYRDVVPVTRGPGGRLELAGPDTAVEWVLRMHRFPKAAELETLAEDGRIDDPMADALGAAVASYHTAAPVRDADGSELIAEILDELERVFADMTVPLGAARISSFLEAARRAHGKVAPLLSRRGRAGFVRRCHGDLHLRNIVLIDGRPTPFDALEFDERLGTCDVLYDFAFLLMDLWHRGLRRAANLAFNSYLARAPENLPALAGLPLFLSVRSAIRAMVEVQTGAVAGGHHQSEARAYLDEALGFLAPFQPRLVAVGGISGTGKTTLARALAWRLGPPPGALHLRSDVERKLLFGADPLTRLPAAAYAPEISGEVYASLRNKAQKALAAGYSVLLDAAHLSEDQRRETRATAGNLPFKGLWLEAPRDTLLARVAARHSDASDADSDVVRRQLARSTEAPGWHRIGTDRAFEAVLSEAAEHIGAS